MSVLRAIYYMFQYEGRLVKKRHLVIWKYASQFNLETFSRKSRAMHFVIQVDAVQVSALTINKQLLVFFQHDYFEKAKWSDKTKLEYLKGPPSAYMSVCAPIRVLQIGCAQFFNTVAATHSLLTQIQTQFNPGEAMFNLSVKHMLKYLLLKTVNLKMLTLGGNKLNLKKYWICVTFSTHLLLYKNSRVFWNFLSNRY